MEEDKARNIQTDKNNTHARAGVGEREAGSALSASSKSSQASACFPLLHLALLFVVVALERVLLEDVLAVAAAAAADVVEFRGEEEVEEGFVEEELVDDLWW